VVIESFINIGYCNQWEDPGPPSHVLHRGLNKVPLSAISIGESASTGSARFGSSQYNDVVATILLGDLVNGGIWSAPILSIDARLHVRPVQRSPVSNSSVVSVTSPTEEATSQHQKMLRHQPQFVCSIELNVRSHYKEDKWLSTIKESGETRTYHNLHINCFQQRISHRKEKGHLNPKSPWLNRLPTQRR
jgi:hypothetical protein